MRIAWIAFALSLLAFGQKPARVQKPVSPTIASVAAADAPAALGEAAYKKIRDLEYKQDREIIRLKELKLQEDEAQKKVDALTEEIRQAAYDEAVREGLDVGRYRLELDTLTWTDMKKGGKK